MATRRLLPILGGAGSAALAGWSLWRPDTASADAANTGRELSVDNVPSRTEQYQRLMASKMENPFDVLVIGGGATGAGCTFDAQTRSVQRNSWCVNGALGLRVFRGTYLEGMIQRGRRRAEGHSVSLLHPHT